MFDKYIIIHIDTYNITRYKIRSSNTCSDKLNIYNLIEEYGYCMYNENEQYLCIIFRCDIITNRSNQHIFNSLIQNTWSYTDIIKQAIALIVRQIKIKLLLY
jgi:hypothetical protein